MKKLIFGNNAKADIYEVRTINNGLADYDIGMGTLSSFWNCKMKYRLLRAYLPTYSTDVVKSITF